MDTLTMPPPPAPPRAAPTTATVSDDRAPRRLLGPSGTTRALLVLTVALATVAGFLAYRRVMAVRHPRYLTETVARGQVTGVLQVAAWLEPAATVRIGAENSGRVSSVAVTVGERVRQGQVLARLDVRALRADTASTEAQAMAAQIGVRQAEARLGKIIYLLELMGEAPHVPQHHAHRAELEAAAMIAETDLVKNAADFQKYASAIVQLREQVAAAVLRAPIEGVVVRRAIEPGEMATPGVPLFVITAPPSDFRLVAQVGETDVDRVRPGRASFTVPSLQDRRFEALVVAVEPEPKGDRPPFSYHVRLLVHNDRGLRAGMTALVSLPLASAPNALLAPTEALRFRPEGTPTAPARAVHVLDRRGRPLRVPLEVGVTDGTSVEIRGTGLAPGTPVIVAGPS